MFLDIPTHSTLDPIITVEEGNKMSLQCDAVSHPPAKITWFFAADRVNYNEITDKAVVQETPSGEYSTNVISKIMFDGNGISRYDTGNYYCVIKNTEANFESRTNVTVQCKFD